MAKPAGDGLSHPQKILLRFFGMRAFDNMRNAIRRLHPSDVAGVFPHLSQEEQGQFMDILFEESRAAIALTYLPEEMASDLLAGVPTERVAAMVQRVSADDAADILGCLNTDRQSDVLALLPDNRRWALEKLLLYSVDSAGGIMNTDYLALDQGLSVEEALRVIRARFRAENYLYAYVVDEMNHLLGVLSFRELVFAEPTAMIRDIMMREPVRVAAETPQEEVAKVVADYDLLAVPVVNEHSKLIGVVTVDDVIDVIEEEATEDMYHLANLHGEVTVFTPLLRTVRLRLSMALVSLAAASLVGLTVSLFQETLRQVIVLAAFIPVLTQMTGSVGTQSVTVVVRALVLGELDFRRSWRVVLKECAVGGAMGLLSGIVLGGAAFALTGRPVLAALAAASLTASLLVAALVGAFIPLLLGWLRFDPARGAGLIATTVGNVATFLLFFGLASLWPGLLID